MKADRYIKILERIQNHPELLESVEAILDIAENKSGELLTADEAEEKTIEELGKLGKELLAEWAKERQNTAIEQARETHPTAKRHEKKNSIGNRPMEKSK